jgi:hypothetical protein
MNARVSRLILGLVLTATPLLSVGCGSSSSSAGSIPPPVQNGTVQMMISDASTEDWATIGVKIQAISLLPQGGGSPVSIYTAPNPPPVVNLVELDQLAEILGNITVPAGTYSGATLTIGGNPGDVLLVVAANPENGFAGTPSATIPSNQIQIQGTTGSAGSLTVPVNVNFITPLVVTANQNNALDLEFDLSHPAFLVGHVPPGSGTTIWAVNFHGPVRHHPIANIARLVLRHLYGNVSSVASDDSSITITRDFPVEPPTNPETAVASSQTLQILSDSTNGTIFYDLDTKTSLTIRNFTAEASSLVGKYVRVAARYQPNGTLVAVRVWASSSFQSVWVSPEGHVLHVNTSTNVITIENEVGIGVPLTVDTNTQFFFRVPANAQADATPIGTGTAFLAAGNLVRGFKVHASVVDPLATPLVAQTVDIEIARYDGSISGATRTNFLYTRKFFTSSDNYTFLANYISPNTPNGKDANGNPVLGFKWWNFTFPTLATTGSSAISSFVSAANGSVSFGGAAGTLSAWSESFATWNDPANANGWAVPWTVLLPTPAPLASVAAGYSNGSFAVTVPHGTNAVTVDASTTSGSAMLVYQVDRTHDVVSVSSQDITTSAGLSTFTANLVAGTPVKIFGVPQADGTIKAYVVVYFTGTKSTS